MKYYIIAGEASGDLHGSNLMHELKSLDSNAEFRCWGGDKMQAQGGKIIKHYRDLAFMGFTEVLLNIRTILRNINFCKSDITNYKPDAIILVDYPGFNLRIAEFAKAKGYKVFYYISPQIWAWKQSRVHKIKRVTDKVFTILPFEKDFYKKFNYEVDFVGHPLLDALDNSEIKPLEVDKTNKPIVALLPGSRKQEISAMLPIMLETSKHFLNHRFIVAAAPSIDKAIYKDLTNGFTNIEVVYGKTYDILKSSSAALVTSGTATLETALIGTPEVVCYKAGNISYAIAKQLVKVKYISLVNLIIDKPAVKELIQHDLNEKNLTHELGKLLNDYSYIQKIKTDYALLREKLGGPGASKKTATLIWDYLN